MICFLFIDEVNHETVSDIEAAFYQVSYEHVSMQCVYEVMVLICQPAGLGLAWSC